MYTACAAIGYNQVALSLLVATRCRIGAGAVCIASIAAAGVSRGDIVASRWDFASIKNGLSIQRLWGTLVLG